MEKLKKKTKNNKFASNYVYMVFGHLKAVGKIKGSTNKKTNLTSIPVVSWYERDHLMGLFLRLEMPQILFNMFFFFFWAKSLCNKGCKCLCLYYGLLYDNDFLASIARGWFFHSIYSKAFSSTKSCVVDDRL